MKMSTHLRTHTHNEKTDGTTKIKWNKTNRQPKWKQTVKSTTIKKNWIMFFCCYVCVCWCVCVVCQYLYACVMFSLFLKSLHFDWLPWAIFHGLVIHPGYLWLCTIEHHFKQLFTANYLVYFHGNCKAFNS